MFFVALALVASLGLQSADPSQERAGAEKTAAAPEIVFHVLWLAYESESLFGQMLTLRFVSASARFRRTSPKPSPPSIFLLLLQTEPFRR